MSEHRRIATCPGCGSDVPARALSVHVCDWGSWLDHQVDLRRGEIERFERELGAYLDSPGGRFELWYAEQRRFTRP